MRHKHDLKFFKDAQKAYGKIAKIKISANKVSMINVATGSSHLFVDGSKEIQINDEALLNKIKVTFEIQ